MEKRRACVIGWPINHSRSPLIHNYWLRQHSIEGEYCREAVEPANFPLFVRDLARHGYIGANVTLPHKEAALRLSEADARAHAIGAANTLWLEGGRLHATNTDVEGFIGNLDSAAPGWDRAKEIVVLGAGGSARAVLFGLIERGIAHIALVNRSRHKADTLAQAFGPSVTPYGWERLPALLAGADLLINTTSLGMSGQPPLLLDVSRLPGGAVVADLVYAPLETELLTAAAARGLRTADGLGMLLHQAVRGFSLWFGVTPEVTPELRQLVERDLLEN